MVDQVDENSKFQGVDKRRTDIFVSEFVSQTNTLGLMFDRSTINDGNLELFDNRSVNLVTLRARHSSAVA